jgi:hypothetical protein
VRSTIFISLIVGLISSGGCQPSGRSSIDGEATATREQVVEKSATRKELSMEEIRRIYYESNNDIAVELALKKNFGSQPLVVKNLTSLTATRSNSGEIILGSLEQGLRPTILFVVEDSKMRLLENLAPNDTKSVNCTYLSYDTSNGNDRIFFSFQSFE